MHVLSLALPRSWTRLHPWRTTSGTCSGQSRIRKLHWRWPTPAWTNAPCDPTLSCAVTQYSIVLWAKLERLAPPSIVLECVWLKLRRPCSRCTETRRGWKTILKWRPTVCSLTGISAWPFANKCDTFRTEGLKKYSYKKTCPIQSFVQKKWRTGVMNLFKVWCNGMNSILCVIRCSYSNSMTSLIGVSVYFLTYKKNTKFWGAFSSNWSFNRKRSLVVKLNKDFINREKATQSNSFQELKQC